MQLTYDSINIRKMLNSAFRTLVKKIKIKILCSRMIKADELSFLKIKELLIQKQNYYV